MASDRENSTILLVDDHPLMRKGLRALLEGEPGLEVAGEADDGEEAIVRARALSPDIVVMDVSMPRLNGIEATRRLLEEAPRTRVLALSIHSEKRFVDEMLRAGAAGYLLKDSAPEELVRAVRALLRGESYLSAPLIGTLISSLRQTPSEQTPAPSPGRSPDGARAPDPPRAGTGEATTQAPAISAPLVLRTKLYPPTFPADMVPRADLLERLEAGKTRPLALVSAPAGYGKSLLVGSWLESCGWASAWLSLDEGDGDLRQFLSGLVDAVQTRFPAACASSRRLTEAHELPSVKTLSTALSNDLDALPEPLVLALDDYHRIDGGSPVNELLQRLLALPPIPLHLVIATRRDPPLPLAKLRAMGQITEIRMSDLRFGPSETRALLARSAGFSPGDRALANLDRELEGWVVGLRLVSLALRESEDPDGFLVGLHGGVQQTEEYLVQEVIGRQPPRLRDWLLRSAILDRFCPSLCDAVCAGGDNREAGEESAGDKAARGEGAAVGTDGAFDGARFTQALKAGNLFTIALDAQERWFRFHHLFQELLLRELKRRVGAREIAGLHMRASRWFEAQGMIDEAVRHALGAGDSAAAAEIVERHWRAELDRDRWYIAKRWLDRLPVEIREKRPGLLLAEAWIALFQQKFEELASLVERLGTLPGDHADEPRYAQGLSFFNGLIEYWQGNAERGVRFLEKAIEQVPERPGLSDGAIGFYYGLALCMKGEKARAIRTLSDMMSGAQLPVLYRSQLMGALAFAHLVCGDLVQAMESAQRLAPLAREGRTANSEAWSDYLLACMHFHANELDAAQRHFASAVRQPHILEPKGAIDAFAGMALTHALLGQSREADETLDRLDAFARELGSSEHLLVADSCRARVRLLRGEIAAAHWPHSIDPVPTPDGLFTWVEVPSITRARILTAFGSAGSLKDAAEQLETIRRLSEQCRFIGQTIEVAVLQALVLEKQGRGAEALDALEEAVAMAAPGGWVRPFVEAGPSMAGLLERLAGRSGSTEQLHAILEALRPDTRPPASTPSPSGPAGEIRLQESLTRRELEILELLAQRLQNKEIASHLFVSVDTVKTHLKNLYQKLGVANRREAAAKAAEILAPRPPETPSAERTEGS